MSIPRVPTLKDVAKHAGVHVATASRALNTQQSHLVSEATRTRVQAAADALGYRTNAVAQSLRTGTTGTIGVVVPDLANPFVVSIIRGVEHGTRRENILPLVVETHDEPEQLRSAVSRLLGNRVDGIVLCAAHTTDEEFVADLEGKIPVVLALRGFDQRGRSAPGARRFEVLHDDIAGARAAVTHLIEQGHTRIAQLPGNQVISSFIERGQGFAAALAAHPEVEDLSSGAHATEHTVAEGRRLAAEALAAPAGRRPTALFAHNDLMAVGALDALRELGLRCPEDVSVVGYNDAPLSDHLDPPLTTVRLPSYELGKHSARLLLSAIEGDASESVRTMLAPELVLRESTRPPADRASADEAPTA